MSEEEIIERLSERIQDSEDVDRIQVFLTNDITAIQGLLDLYKKEKEENGKLRVEIEKLYQDNLTLVDGLKQEKEKNKELEEKLKIATAMLTKGTYPEENEGDNDFDKQFISKNKIEKIRNNYLKKALDIESLNMFKGTTKKEREEIKFYQNIAEILKLILKEA